MSLSHVWLCSFPIFYFVKALIFGWTFLMKNFLQLCRPLGGLKKIRGKKAAFYYKEIEWNGEEKWGVLQKKKYIVWNETVKKKKNTSLKFYLIFFISYNLRILNMTFSHVKNKNPKFKKSRWLLLFEFDLISTIFFKL